jgi:hypothetical protein
MFAMSDSPRDRSRRFTAAAAAAAAMLAASPVFADDEPPAANYVVAALGTTLVHRNPGGPVDGWQHDLSPILGVGRFVRETVAIELDVSPTFLDGEYAALSLVPGAVWAFSPHVYAAARVIVVVDPGVDLTLFPGIGLLHGFSPRLSGIAELNLLSTVTRDDPDIGAALTIGALYSF